MKVLVSNTFDPRSEKIGGVQYLIKTYLDREDNDFINMYLNKIFDTNFIALLKLLYSNRTDCEVVFFGYADKSVIVIAFLCKVMRLKTTIIPAFHPWFTLRRKFMGKIYEKYIFPFLFNKANILCLSNFERGYFQSLLGTNENIKLMKGFLDPFVKKLESENKKNKLKNAHAFDLIFIGRNDNNKQFRKFIEFVEFIRKTQKISVAAIISSTNICDLDELNTIVEASKIKLFTTLDEEKYQAVLMQSKCLVVPSLWESFSYASCEILWFGGRVIVSDQVLAFEQILNGDLIMKINFNQINDLNIDDLRKFITSARNEELGKKIILELKEKFHE